MLSFLFRLARHFELEHGYRPNLLYLNHRHFSQLKSELAQIPDLEEISMFLGMDVVFTDDASHPHVAWHHGHWCRTIAV